MIGLATKSNAVSIAFSAYGASASISSNFLSRGREVVLPEDPPVEIRFGISHSGGKRWNKSKAVVTFAADGLNFGCADTRLRGDALVEATHPFRMSALVLAASITPPSRITLSAMIMVPGCENFSAPIEIVVHRGFVGVDEDEIKRSALFRREFWK